MNQEERKTAIRRMRVLVAAACILMLLYGLRLIFLQLVNGDDFKSQATNTTDYKFTVTAARGDIVDSRGAQQAADGRRRSGRDAPEDRRAAACQR